MMVSLFTPRWVRESMIKFNSLNESDKSIIMNIKSRLTYNPLVEPEVSVVIPAWNEEKNIISTLSTLSRQVTNYSFEVIVIDNNSTDKTKEIAEACGIRVFTETVQGISFARQNGLINARGKYLLCADADTFYPEKWIENMVSSLKTGNVSCVYATYSLIPPKGYLRTSLIIYEVISGILFKMRRKQREYLNVMGFSFGFKKADGIKVGGFNTKRKYWSDGWMAMQLMEIGTILAVDDYDVKVWTNSRRLLADGSIFTAFLLRIKKEIVKLKEYLIKTPINKGVSFVERN
jgi:glycosyltransferase involved in cell wall biosynthesis